MALRQSIHDMAKKLVFEKKFMGEYPPIGDVKWPKKFWSKIVRCQNMADFQFFTDFWPYWAIFEAPAIPTILKIFLWKFHMFLSMYRQKSFAFKKISIFDFCILARFDLSPKRGLLYQLKIRHLGFWNFWPFS